MKRKLIAMLILVSATIGTSFAQNPAESMMNLISCRQADHNFDIQSKECIYCAKNLEYDGNRVCKGFLSPIGKCIGDDHFHAATKECMYCAKGFVFDEKLRRCEPLAK